MQFEYFITSPNALTIADAKMKVKRTNQMVDSAEGGASLATVRVPYVNRVISGGRRVQWRRFIWMPAQVIDQIALRY